jgi:hypothetical protein
VRKKMKYIAIGSIMVIFLGLLLQKSFAYALPQQSNDLYLPLILREPPAPILLANGDFEQGPVIWDEFSTHGYELITKDLGIDPFDGQWAAWLGGVYDEVSYIEQQVTVPNNLRYLSFWHAIYSADTCGNDFEHVLVNSTEVFTYDLCDPNDTDGWVHVAIDLSAYANQSVMIQIRAECNGTYNSNLFVDHVGFQYNSQILSQPAKDFTVAESSPLRMELQSK